MMVIVDDDNGGMMLMMTTMMMMTRFVVLIFLYLRFKGGVRADWRCSGCVVMTIIMTVGDAEDAR